MAACAAATVTDLDAEVLLFAGDSPSHWTDYRILFDHWSTHGLATGIRERLSIVSVLTLELGAGRYLEGFREQSWNLFRDRLHDTVPRSDTPTSGSPSISWRKTPLTTRFLSTGHAVLPRVRR